MRELFETPPDTEEPAPEGGDEGEGGDAGEPGDESGEEA
jgi:hypothetical protein